MQKLQTVNAETLLYEPLEKPSFVVDSLIPTGLSLFCGSQKIGKSWLMLKLCLCVSQGIPLWDMPTMEGDVLYLCLEDTFCRIQDRLPLIVGRPLKPCLILTGRQKLLPMYLTML